MKTENRPTFIIDASVAVKWFIDEDNGTKAAKDLLFKVMQDPSIYFTTDLFYVEMISVLSRVVPNPDKLKVDITNLEQLGLPRIPLGHEILQKVCHYTMKYSLSAYDGLYISIADSISGKWVTADKKAYKKVEKLGLCELVV